MDTSSVVSEVTGVMPTGVTGAFDFMTKAIGNMITIVTDNPVLCLGIAIWAVGGAIGLFKRLV